MRSKEQAWWRLMKRGSEEGDLTGRFFDIMITKEKGKGSENFITVFNAQLLTVDHRPSALVLCSVLGLPQSPC